MAEGQRLHAGCLRSPNSTRTSMAVSCMCPLVTALLAVNLHSYVARLTGVMSASSMSAIWEPGCDHLLLRELCTSYYFFEGSSPIKMGYFLLPGYSQ